MGRGGRDDPEIAYHEMVKSVCRRREAGSKKETSQD